MFNNIKAYFQRFFKTKDYVWIHVKDKLPLSVDKYFVTVVLRVTRGAKTEYTSRVVSVGWNGVKWDIHNFETVVAWMPRLVSYDITSDDIHFINSQFKVKTPIAKSKSKKIPLLH